MDEIHVGRKKNDLSTDVLLTGVHEGSMKKYTVMLISAKEGDDSKKQCALLCRMLAAKKWL